MQACSREADSSWSRLRSCPASAAAALMSAMLLSSMLRAADSRARSRYSRSLRGATSRMQWLQACVFYHCTASKRQSGRTVALYQLWIQSMVSWVELVADRSMKMSQEYQECHLRRPPQPLLPSWMKGRSSRLASRKLLRPHSRPCTSPFSAPFACRCMRPQPGCTAMTHDHVRKPTALEQLNH